jgi:hypothetical protein
MVVNGFRFLFPLYETPGDPGGGGGDGGADVSAGTEPAAEPATPSVMELTDDSLVRYPGAKEPVPFKNLRNFQAQWTKEAQRRAAVEAQLKQEQMLRQRYEQERQQASQAQRQGQQADVYDQLRQLPYLSGEDAVGVVQSIGAQLSQRDKIIYGMAQHLQKMEQRLNSVYDNHTSSTFDTKITGFLNEMGYDPQYYGDLAKELYLAYEGDDLDQEFPNIFRSRVEQIERAIEAKRQSALQRNRARFVPGKGGGAGPSKPLQFKGDESPSSIADQLWESLHPSGT